ncbi:HAD family hydrolase [Cyanobium sp. ATX 6A2]|uniref:HAD family hydrolase n=1 Tax=Cyanobium sp. ATX 6A2 TaxID=2823700 RepID=UPI0020CE61A7|nr:HAD family hydrolase [Cyanobium sp. ATX 6A2]MCP9887916.1 HAD family hydrolase [Cyanobium sp. ATX 6A2]
MPDTPLLVCDFDGVLVDGMPEYWWSARRAVLQLQPGLALPEQAPPGFARLRPLMHQGWEMVLMAAELSRSDLDLEGLLAAYDDALPRVLKDWGWGSEQLQTALEDVRRQALAHDLPGWLALHRFFPGVVERLRRLAGEHSEWLVLTTKGGAFARRILEAAELEPRTVYGHEQGSKPEVLERLLAEGRPLWFLEDRRPTLEQVLERPQLQAVRCFLVSWGYLAPGDAQDLPERIQWLEPAQFQQPLAQWPGSDKVRVY